jgi:hypothetical protein
MHGTAPCSPQIPCTMKKSNYHSRSNQTAKIVLHVVSCRVKYIVQTAPQVAVVGTRSRDREDLKTGRFRSVYLDCSSIQPALRPARYERTFPYVTAI